MARSKLFSATKDRPFTFKAGDAGSSTGYVGTHERYSVTPDRRGDYVDTPSRDWQKCAWDLYDVVAEIQQASRLTANSASMANICPAKRDGCDVARLDFSEEEIESGERVYSRYDYGEERVERIDPDDLKALRLGNEILSNIFGKAGQSTILRLIVENLFVGGESWLVQGIDESSKELLDDDFEVMNPCRIVTGHNNRLGYNDSDGMFQEFREDQTRIRLLYAHPRDPRLPMSSVRGIIHEAQILVLLRNMMEATSKSGIHAGVVMVPDELTTTLGRDEFEARLMKAFLDPINNPNSASAVAPTMINGAAEYIKELVFLTQDRPFDEVLPEMLDRVEKRILRGLDLPVEIISGFGEANHWSSWEINSTWVRNHIKPILDIILEALYRKIYRKVLEENGLEPDKYCYDADTTDIAGEPNKAKNANDAFDRGALDHGVYLQALGFNPATDMANPIRTPYSSTSHAGNAAESGEGVGGRKSTDRQDGVNPSRPDDNINNQPINGDRSQ